MENIQTSTGLIRQKMALAKHTLQTRIAEAGKTKFRMPAAEQSVEEQLENCDVQLRKLEANLALLETAKERMEKLDDQWMSLLQEIEKNEDAETYSKEAEVYNKWLTDESSCLGLIRAADQVSDVLKLYIRDAQVATKRLQNSCGIPKEEGTSRQSELQEPVSFPQQQFLRAIAEQRMKLPTINLPCFKGEKGTWEDFSDRFKSAVDEQPLTEIDKLTYLKTCLQGEPAEVAKGYSNLSTNYKPLFHALKEMYGDDEFATNVLNKQLTDLKPARSNAEIRLTFAKVDSILRQLEAKGESIDNSLMWQVVESKFPRWLHVQIEKEKRKTDAWTFKKFSDVLLNIIKTQENVNVVHGEEEKERHRRYPQREEIRRNKPTGVYERKSTAIVAVSARNGNNKDLNHRIPGSRNPELRKTPNSPCLFCGRTHWNDECTQYTLDQKKNILKEKKLCFICFKAGHNDKECQRYRLCIYCNGKHNRAICPSQSNGDKKRSKAKCNLGQSGETEENKEESTDEESEQSFITTVSTGNRNDKPELFWTREATVVNPNQPQKTKKILIIFDNGSDKSYILQDLAKELQLEILEEKKLNLTGAAEIETKHVSQKVNIGIKDRNGDMLILKPMTLKKIMSPVQHVQLPKTVAELLNKNGASEFVLPAPVKKKPEMLIGKSVMSAMIDYSSGVKDNGFIIFNSLIGPIISTEESIEIKKIPPRTLMALQRSRISKTVSSEVAPNCGERSRFDLVLNPQLAVAEEGKTNCGERSQSERVYGPQPVFYKKEYAALIIARSQEEELNHTLQKFWALDSLGITEDAQARGDEEAMLAFEKTIEREPNGRFIVGWPWKQARPNLSNNFGLAFGRLRSNFYRMKGKTDLLEKCNEIINDQLKKDMIEKIDDIAEDGPLVSYIPHQVVETPSKTTTKVRMVFDASAARQKGRSLNENLYPGPILLPKLAGILLRARLSPILVTADVEKAFLQVGLRECDRDVTRFLWLKDVTKPPTKMNLQVYRFKRIPFGATSSPFLLNCVIRHLLSQENTELARAIIQNIYVDNVLITAENSHEAIKKSQEVKRIFATAQMNLREFLSNDDQVNKIFKEKGQELPDEEKLLGISWNRKTDSLILKTKRVEQILNSKRKEIQFAASNFDPLGYLIPALLKWKLMMQKLCRGKYQWDEKLKEEDQAEIQKLTENWSETVEYEIPRYCDCKKRNLHVFTDASAKAMAAVVYLRDENNTKAAPRLFYARSRLTPIKEKVSMPRLELMGVLLGVRVIKFLRAEIQPDEIHLWTDSTTILNWIKSPPPGPRFVTNRLQEIMETEKVKFNYVPTKENPADIATRGLDLIELKTKEIWWKGPSWLKEEKTFWPKFSQERNQKRIFILQNQIEKPRWQNDSFKIIDVSRYSSWEKLLKITAWVLRAVKLFTKNRIPWLQNGEHKKSLTLQELKEAKVAIFRQAQAAVTLLDLKTWDLRLDDNHLWRCHGRLNANLPRIEKHPIFLPRSDETKLLILSIHRMLYHANSSSVVTELRRNYWLPKATSTVKTIIRTSCAHCQRWSSQPFKMPAMAPYAANRLQLIKPFENVGIDYFGPLTVKSGENLIKRWVCLFTCLSTRNIHLLVVDDLSAEKFLNSFRQFCATFGQPKSVVSDNGSNFVLTAKTLLELKQKLQQKEIEWKFITQSAPWQGGMYERMVGITKNALKKAIGKRLLQEKELNVLLAEIAAIVNSRPLTYLAEDTLDVLRPIDFIRPFAEVVLDPAEEDTADPTYSPTPFSPRQRLINQWRGTLKVVKKFWNFWQDAYVTSLRGRTQREHRGQVRTTNREPRVGEVVIVKEENIPRGMWKLAKVEALSDGKAIRSAIIRLANGKLWKRTVNYLFPLEIQTEKETTEDGNIADPNLEAESQEESEEKITPKKLRRLAVTKERTAKERNPSSLSWWILPTILMAVLACTTAKQVQCGPKGQEAIVAIPEYQYCAQKFKNVSYVTVTIATRQYVHFPAVFCAGITRTVCTHSFLRLVMEVTKDEIHAKTVSEKDCREMHERKALNGTKLNKISPTQWKSEEATSYSYGWWGQTCKDTVNYVLEEGSIAYHNGDSVLSRLTTTQQCKLKEGKCSSDESIILWNQTDFSKICTFKRQGTFTAYVTDNHYIIKDLQVSYVLRKNPFQGPAMLCPFQNPMATTQPDVVLILEDSRKVNAKLKMATNDAEKRDLLVEKEDKHRIDGENSKFQFLYDFLYEKLEQQWHNVCKNRNHVTGIIRHYANNNPRIAAEIILGREDVTEARKIGKVIMARCAELRPTFPKPTNAEDEEIIFNAERIEGEQYKDVILQAEKINAKWITAQDPDSRNGSVSSRLQSDISQILTEIEYIADKSATSLLDEIQSVRNHWRMILFVIIAVGALILIGYISQQLQWLPVICSKLRIRKRRITKTRSPTEIQTQEMTEIPHKASEERERKAASQQGPVGGTGPTAVCYEPSNIPLLHSDRKGI